MRSAIMAALALLGLAGPAMAFDFTARSFADVLNARLAALDLPTRVFLITCSPADGGETCALGAAKGVLVYNHTPTGASAPDYVATSWDRAPQTEVAFDQATVALLTLCSPGATEEERARTLHALIDPIDKKGITSTEENDSLLDGNLFASKLVPGTGIMIKIVADPNK